MRNVLSAELGIVVVNILFSAMWAVIPTFITGVIANLFHVSTNWEHLFLFFGSAFYIYGLPSVTLRVMIRIVEVAVGLGAM